VTHPALIVVIVLSALTAACSGGGAPAGAPESSTGSAAPAYPEAYKDLGLPELPGGILTSTGRQTASLRDGLNIRLTTAVPVTDVRRFYSEALAELGWEETPARVLPGAAMAGLEATRDDLRFSATITSMGGSTAVQLSIVQQ